VNEVFKRAKNVYEIIKSIFEQLQMAMETIRKFAAALRNFQGSIVLGWFKGLEAADPIDKCVRLYRGTATL
jgi:hypothetical protein